MGIKPAAKRDIASALFTTTQRNVFEILFADPAQSFIASEIIERARVGSGSVQRELARLVESGLVTAQLIGRQRHYRANAASPVFEDLRNIVIKTSGIPALIRGALGAFASRITLAFLFGSIAKGESRGDSDIDLLIVADGLLLEELYSSLERPEMKLRRKISPTLYSSKEFAQRLEKGNVFLTKVLAGATIPLLGNLDAVSAARQSREDRKAESGARRPR